MTACAETTPLPLGDRHADLLGVWQQRIEKSTDNSNHIDNMLLAIYADSTAVYRLCELDETWTENSNSRRRSSVSYPDAVITDITDNSITVGQKVELFGMQFGFDNEIIIDRAPYTEDGQWHVELEGKKLMKLTGPDVMEMTDWSCPEDDEEKG